MEIKFNIKKTSKNSLEDLLDIRKKNVKSEYWEELESQEESEVETKPKKTIRICFEEYQKIKAEPFSELGPYMNTIFFQFNYSPIINKLFPSLKKEKYERIESLNHSWRHYNCEVNACIHKTRSDTFSKKILQVYVSFINKYLSHVFGISKISEALNILNKKLKFKIYDFANETEEKTIYLYEENELKGNGCTFIFLKELRRLYDCLVYSQQCFKMSILYMFFYGVEKLSENIFYEYVTKNEVVSTLLYQIKLIFEKNSEDNDVINFINNFTIGITKDLKKDEYDKKIDNIYHHPEFNERCYQIFAQEYEAIDKYNLDIIPKKINYVYKEVKDLEKDYKLNGDEPEIQEDEKVKEIKDLDELVKYIQGDEKKKKKKKKKKENPINKLEQFNVINKNVEDDQMSIVSHDTIFSNFKKDIRSDNIEDENLIKIKPNLSENFIENLK